MGTRIDVGTETTKGICVGVTTEHVRGRAAGRTAYVGGFSHGCVSNRFKTSKTARIISKSAKSAYETTFAKIGLDGREAKTILIRVDSANFFSETMGTLVVGLHLFLRRVPPRYFLLERTDIFHLVYAPVPDRKFHSVLGLW